MKKVGLENAHLTSITTLSGATFCPPSPNSLNSFSLSQDSTHTPPFSSCTFSSTSSLTFFFSLQFSFLFSFLSYPSLTLYRPFFSAAIFFFSCLIPLYNLLWHFLFPFHFTFLSNPNCFSLWPCFFLSFSSCLSTLSPISLPRTFSNQTAS